MISRSHPLVALAALCLVAFALYPASAPASDADNLDKLLAPIALYPDALLAQILTASTSPDQVTEFSKWLKDQTATGSDLQQAAMNAKFDAAFASLAIFPDVVKLLADNMDWTKEIGTAYLSSKDQVNTSIQRLRAQAKEKGNLKSNEQQKVEVNSEGGSQTIIIEPANPQVVYVPQYDPNVVYTQSASSSSSNDAAVAALVGFTLGIAIGAAMSNDYYGWGAWGYGWHGGGAYYHRSVWVVPARPRYPYARPVPNYRPRGNVATPRNTNVNRNGNSNRTNAGNRVDSKDVDRRDASRDKAKAGDRGGAKTDRESSTARGRPSTNDKPGRPESDAFGGYGNGSSTRASSDRGRSSVASSKGGGSSRGGGRSGGGGGGRRR
ncbi:MAG TPA: DUF3300 domain-containing protein [Candidatus Eisenbacteria bacterium]|nr:DUF3300 domain-containing protein [Candidatus Eisenbacteria bacterium]